MDEKLFKKRHSYAHVLAAAVLDMFPEAKLAIGPVIDNGFYYDFDLPRTLIPEDLELLEEKMKALIKKNEPFEMYAKSSQEALAFLQEAEQPYKEEIVQDLMAKEGVTEVTFYKTGESFVDLCEGPHVKTTQTLDATAFKLDKIAGAYWRGDEKRPMLQRIYGLAFNNKKDLNEYLKQREEAKKRDHRVLGESLKLFTISPLVGAGLPLLQPNGMIIRSEVEKYLWELHKDKGYQRVWTPHIAKIDLYETSGHAAKFGDELFKVQGKDDEFIMKPMNCPHHMQIFDDNQFSYRDMPVRLFEPATVYRDEKTGQLSGLTRVRAITQDDGHLFCRVSQINEEVKTIVSIIKEFYTTLGMTEDYWVSLSVRDDSDNYLGEDDVWEAAESALEGAAKESELPYVRIEGEAAFYGPKLDFMFKDCLGREWQLATIQCDFNLPERFKLSFINEEGEKEQPVVIHRAVSGSLERFIGVMTEHFGGAFPTWLSPTQVMLLPVADVHEEFARKLASELQSHDVRVKIMDSNLDSLSKRIRNSELKKIPYMVVIGDKELEGPDLAVRSYKTKKQSTMPKKDFMKELLSEISERKL